MKLMQVKGEWILNWPALVLGPYEVPKRGTRGYVVDLDAPLEAATFCKGQEYKLEPAPKGAQPSALENSKARMMVAEWQRKNAPQSAKAAATKPGEKPVQHDLPAVDLPKPKVAAKA
jgi:hypothetical protein